jgi:hypothetical protein
MKVLKAFTIEPLAFYGNLISAGKEVPTSYFFIKDPIMAFYVRVGPRL